MTAAIQGEAMLLDWRESARGGAVLVLQLPSPDDLDPFRAMTLKKGKIAGQRLMYAFVEVDEQEQPITPPAPGKGGQLSVLAARWCRDREFQDWVAATDHALRGKGSTVNEAGAAVWVRQVCDVDSRAELDHDAKAAGIFDHFIRKPYLEHLQSGARFNP